MCVSSPSALFGRSYGRRTRLCGWNFKKAAKKIFEQTCGCSGHAQQQSYVVQTSTENRERNISSKKTSSEINGKSNASTSTPYIKNLCSICLDPLNCSSGRAIFTAQCSHAFHFACISSNVRHGGVTCPVCRDRWTQLPRNLNTGWSIRDNKTDPILQILDEYIATSRDHRRSFRHSAHQEDVDTVCPHHARHRACLDIISTPS